MATETPEGDRETGDQVGGETRTNRARPDALRDLSAELLGSRKPDEDDASDDDADGTEDGNTDPDADAGEHDADGDQDGRGNSEPPKTLADAAELLGIDVSELYKLEVPHPHSEGETISLGDLKNQLNDRTEFEVKQLQWEESRSEQQAELLRAQQEVEELVTHLPKRLLESDALKAARARLDARTDRERQQTLKVIPEWRNQDTMKGEMAAMIEHLADYGYPKEYLASVTDHRTLRYIRENMQRAQRVRTLLEQVNEKKPGQHRTGKAQGGKSPDKPGQDRQQQRTNSTPSERRSRLIGLMGPSDKG